MWQKTDDHPAYHGGSPNDHGINTVRGQAARAVASLLYEDESRYDALKPTLISLSEDPIISVRTCAIHAFMAVLNFDRDTAVDLFLTACRDCEAICGTHPFERFVSYAIYTHYPALQPLLQGCLQSSEPEAVEIAIRQIVLAQLGGVDVGIDASNIRGGTEAIRKSAVAVYAHNLSHPTVGNACAAHLEEYFDDEAVSVRAAVSNAFFDLTGDRLLELKPMILQYIESKSFENETDSLLHALKESNLELPDVICGAAERILDLIGIEGSNLASHAAGVAHYISILIVRQYEQTSDPNIKTRCLDIIDRMERFGYFGVDDELNKIDR
jgi:hypothetical protein